MMIHHANHVGPISTRLAWGCSWDEHSLGDHGSLSGTAICETQEDSCLWKLCQQVFFWDEIVAPPCAFPGKYRSVADGSTQKDGWESGKRIYTTGASQKSIQIPNPKFCWSQQIFLTLDGLTSQAPLCSCSSQALSASTYRWSIM